MLTNADEQEEEDIPAWCVHPCLNGWSTDMLDRAEDVDFIVHERAVVRGKEVCTSSQYTGAETRDSSHIIHKFVGDAGEDQMLAGEIQRFVRVAYKGDRVGDERPRPLRIALLNLYKYKQGLYCPIGNYPEAWRSLKGERYARQALRWREVCGDVWRCKLGPDQWDEEWLSYPVFVDEIGSKVMYTDVDLGNAKYRYIKTFVTCCLWL